MKHQYIINSVDKSIDSLISIFPSHPTLFYTENDLVCSFFAILKQNLPFYEAPDKEGFWHSLIHSQYPTPFRCDMTKGKFKVMDDDARTEKGTKYQRGHYDLVILNPDFIKQYTYEVINAQNYEKFKKEIRFESWKDNPIVLYGIEFMFSRAPLKWSRGQNNEKGIENFISSILQDYNKLLAAKNIAGFAAKIKMLAFLKGSAEDICSRIKEKLLSNQDITICAAE